MFSITNMTIEDLPEVDKIQRASFVPELWEPVSFFRNIFENAPELCFVAREDKKIVGYLIAYPSASERDDFEKGWKDPGKLTDCIYIQDLCVHPNAQGKGLARLLFSELEVMARKEGFSQLTGIAVQGAESFWLKLGFEILKPYSYHGEPGLLIVKKNERFSLKLEHVMDGFS